MVSSWIIIPFYDNKGKQNQKHSPTISRLKIIISKLANQSAAVTSPVTEERET